MDIIPRGQFDIEGCFVYQVGEVGAIDVRSRPSTSDDYRTGRSFVPGELLSVDLIRHSDELGSGAFLRLSDGSGWVFEYKQTIRCLKRLQVVEDGLYCFYVDNPPNGLALRRHPNDQQHDRELHLYEPNTKYRYRPMQRIYCDRKVAHPDTKVNFYRVQGTNGWVFDRRRKLDADGEQSTVKTWFFGDRAITRNSYKTMLIPKHAIKTGLFAFRVLKAMAVHSEPNVEEDSKTTVWVNPGELIACDIIRDAQKDRHLNGPYVRLTDGSGWLFERKDNDTVLQQVAIDNGLWLLKVRNPPSGINMRRQPIDRQEFNDSKNYLPDELVTCDCRIAAHNGIRFFRVQNSDGWVFDKRVVPGDGSLKTMMGMFSISMPCTLGEELIDNGGAWSPDFVRGAAAVRGLEEIAFNPESRLISFQTTGGTRIHVYFTTRTVATVSDDAKHGKSQIFRRNCTAKELAAIMENPNSDIGGDSQEKQPDALIRHDTPCSDHSEDLRRSLLDCEEEIDKLVKRKIDLLIAIQKSDIAESKSVEAYRAKVSIRKHEQEEEQKRLEEGKQQLCVIQ